MELFTPENPITLVIADDHEIVRAGIKRLLMLEKSMKIIDEAGNGKDAIELVSYHKPMVALLDILMPYLNGIDAVPLIKKLAPDTMVVMLTAFEDSIHLDKALSAGADGYLSKDIAAKDLIDAIQKVALGERVFSKSILSLMQKKFSGVMGDPEPISITKREQEVLNLIAQGKTSAEIAEELFLSVRTIETHRYNLMQKLQCNNIAGLVRYAVLKSLS